jgi:hypothetical protein
LPQVVAADDHVMIGGRRTTRRSLLAITVSVASFVGAAAATLAPSAGQVVQAAPGCGRGGSNEAQLDAAFSRPGLGATAAVQGFGGGDYPHAYPLPDGRVFWMFQDLHFSNNENLLDDVGDGSPTNAAHNAGLIQQGGCFTILGDRGRDLIGDAQTVDGRTWFWPMDGEIGIDGNLWIFMVEMHNPSGAGAGPGALPVRTWVAILDRTTLQQLYFEPAPDSSNRLYGWSVASTDRWSYLYSHCYRQYASPVNGIGQFDAACMPDTYLSRVPKGNFVAAPEYWNGSGWTGDPSSAVPVASRNVANPMSVQWFGDVFVSVTKENEWWGTRLVVDRAPAPQGPWTTVETRSVSGDMKCATCGNYGAFLMPWLDEGGRMIVALSSGGDFDLWRRNAWLYRPTFHSFALPDPPSPLAAATPPAFPAGTADSGFVAVDPERLVDTRQPGQVFATLRPGVTAVLDLSDRMPAGTTAVALNLTTVGSTQTGWVRAFPCNSTEPPTSNVNPDVGRVVTNAAIVPVGDGRVCFTSLGITDLVVDLNGWLTSGSTTGLVSVTRRLADTRTGAGGISRLAPGDVVEIAVTSAASSTTAVALGVTAVDPSANGFVTAWPCGGARPLVSNLNPEAGVTRPNLVNVRVGRGGKVCLFSLQATDLVVDLLGEYRNGSGARYAALAPQRLLDTRAGGRPSHPSNLSDLVPLGALTAAQVNLTATRSEAAGYLTAYSCLSEPWPGTSNANFGAGDTVAGAALMSSSRGYGCVYSSAVTDLVVDIFGVWR